MKIFSNRFHTCRPSAVLIYTSTSKLYIWKYWFDFHCTVEQQHYRMMNNTIVDAVAVQPREGCIYLDLTVSPLKNQLIIQPFDLNISEFLQALYSMQLQK